MSPDDCTEKIELLVNDENRIVTYKSLSHELKIHVNKAKQCMMDYYNAQKLKGISLEVHYFLAGFTEKDGLRAVKVLVVSEDDLEKAKESFNELTSCHLYSIYKGTSKDECALYSADFTYNNDKEQSKYSAIKHPNIEIQPPVLNKMQTTKDVRMNVTKKGESKAATNGSLSSGNSKLEAKVKPSDSILPEKNDVLKNNEIKDAKENKSSPDDKKEKSGTLMSMWQKKDQSNDVKKDKAKPDAKGKGAAKNVPKNNILSMFSKQAVKNAEKPPAPKPPEPKVESPKREVNEVRKETPPKNVSSNESKKSSQKRKKACKQSKSSKSKNDSDSENDFKSKPKKHKRICTFDSSSESEPEEEKEKAQRSFFLPEEPMDVIEATPVTDDEEPIPPTPPVVHVKGKAKVWKTVQKNYEDEDGFFVTKKEKELVSASEDEEDPLKTSNVKKEEVESKKVLPSVNKKQSSLMSFFKQK